jgi:hypothetical protein
VPVNKSSTADVIVRARARPLLSATISITSSRIPMPISTVSRMRLKLTFVSPSRLPPIQLYSAGISTLIAIGVRSETPVCQSTYVR